MALGGKRPGAGRKKGYKAIEAIKAREYLVQRVMEMYEPILNTYISKAVSGDIKAAEYLLSQVIGKPKEMVEITGELSLKLDV